MKLSTAIAEYEDVQLLRYLQEEIVENKEGRQEELMQMMTWQDSKCTSLQFALHHHKSKKVIFKMMDIGGKELLMMNSEDGNSALHTVNESSEPHRWISSQR